MLKYNTLMSHALGHALAVKVLEQRDRVFARNTCKFFECRDGQSVSADSAVLANEIKQVCNRLAMEHQLIRDFDQHLLSEKNLQKLLRPDGFHGQFSKNTRETGHS